MEKEEHEFYLKVARSLAGCQLVEQELKLYITEALLFAKKCVGGRMPFEMSGEDYADAALATLIKVFGRFNDNAALKKAPNDFKVERDFLSHKAITDCIDPEGDLCVPESPELRARLEGIQKEAERLTNAIHEEANKWSAHLYFDVIEDEDGAK